MLGDELLLPRGRGWVGGGLVLGSARFLGGWGVVWVGVAPAGPQLDTPEAKQDPPRWEGTGERDSLVPTTKLLGGGAPFREAAGQRGAPSPLPDTCPTPITILPSTPRVAMMRARGHQAGPVCSSGLEDQHPVGTRWGHLLLSLASPGPLRTPSQPWHFLSSSWA